MISFIPEGVCAREIQFEVQNNIIKHVKFIGGCKGNLKAISKLVEGMPVQDAIRHFKGNDCQNGTSCVDQFARALEAIKE